MERARVLDRCENVVRVDPGGGEHAAQHTVVLDVLSLVVASREQRPVRGGESVGVPVAHGDADLQRRDSCALPRPVPTRRERRP
jgi:hypothetical protein